MGLKYFIDFFSYLFTYLLIYSFTYLYSVKSDAIRLVNLRDFVWIYVYLQYFRSQSLNDSIQRYSVIDGIFNWKRGYLGNTVH